MMNIVNLSPINKQIIRIFFKNLMKYLSYRDWDVWRRHPTTAVLFPQDSSAHYEGRGQLCSARLSCPVTAATAQQNVTSIHATFHQQGQQINIYISKKFEILHPKFREHRDHTNEKIIIVFGKTSGIGFTRLEVLVANLRIIWIK